MNINWSSFITFFSLSSYFSGFFLYIHSLDSKVCIIKDPGTVLENTEFFLEDWDRNIFLKKEQGERTHRLLSCGTAIAIQEQLLSNVMSTLENDPAWPSAWSVDPTTEGCLQKGAGVKWIKGWSITLKKWPWYSTVADTAQNLNYWSCMSCIYFKHNIPDTERMKRNEQAYWPQDSLETWG